jgi:hypothetical protein
VSPLTLQDSPSMRKCLLGSPVPITDSMQCSKEHGLLDHLVGECEQLGLNFEA